MSKPDPIFWRELLARETDEIIIVGTGVRGNLGVYPEGDAFLYVPESRLGLTPINSGAVIEFIKTGERRTVEYIP